MLILMLYCVSSSVTSDQELACRLRQDFAVTRVNNKIFTHEHGTHELLSPYLKMNDHLEASLVNTAACCNVSPACHLELQTTNDAAFSQSTKEIAHVLY